MEKKFGGVEFFEARGSKPACFTMFIAGSGLESLFDGSHEIKEFDGGRIKRVKLSNYEIRFDERTVNAIAGRFGVEAEMLAEHILRGGDLYATTNGICVILHVPTSSVERTLN